MFEVNPFSAKTYNISDKVKIAQDGTASVKVGNDWIAPNGDYIQQTNNGLLNLRTGVNSTFGDPFGDSNDY